MPAGRVLVELLARGLISQWLDNGRPFPIKFPQWSTLQSLGQGLPLATQHYREHTPLDLPSENVGVWLPGREVGRNASAICTKMTRAIAQLIARSEASRRSHGGGGEGESGAGRGERGRDCGGSVGNVKRGGAAYLVADCDLVGRALKANPRGRRSCLSRSRR